MQKTHVSVTREAAQTPGPHGVRRRSRLAATILILATGLGGGAAAQDGETGRTPPAAPGAQGGLPSEQEAAPRGLPAEELAATREEALAFLKARDATDAARPTAELAGILKASQRRWNDLVDLRAELYKRERIAGKLLPSERILQKYLALHKSLYMKWLDGDKKGRELLFAEHLNDGRLIIAAAGRLIWPTQVVQLDPTSSSALEGTVHPHTWYTPGRIGESFMGDWLRARASEQEADLVGVRYRGKSKPVHRKLPECHLFDLWFKPVDRLGVAYPYSHVVLGFDPESPLLVLFDGYRLRSAEKGGEENSEDLMVSYHWYDVKPDCGLAAEEFSPTNPKYKFSR